MRDYTIILIILLVIAIANNFFMYYKYDYAKFYAKCIDK